MENNESSDDSEDTNQRDTLEIVKNLTVKSSTAEEKELPRVEKEDEDDDSTKELEESTRTEEDREQEESSQKEKEESLLHDEEERLKEEKKRDKMKVLLTGYLELKTKKEIEKVLLNEKKIVAQWLYPFRRTYQKEWELEMKKLKLGFQKALDFKKSHINAIQQEWKLVELNHLWADSSHYRISEELFEFLRIRCENLKMRYLGELEKTKDYYLEREKEIISKCTKAEERAKALTYMRKNIHDKTLQQTQMTLESFKREGEFMKEKEIELIKQKHMTYVEMITKEIETSISPPEHKIEEVRALFLEWKLKYESFLQVSEKNKKKLETHREELLQLEAKVTTARKKLDELKNENKMAKQKKMEEMLALQKKHKKCEKLDPSLRKMISTSEAIMVQLRERKYKLDKILKLKKLCDKLENESDKITTNVTLLEPNELEEVKGNDCLPLVQELCSGNIEDHSLLQNFYHKLSRVKLQNQFLQHNIENLKVENKALRSNMKKYLHLISSGEWERTSENECVALFELQGKMRAKPSISEVSEPDKPNLTNNLKLLNDKYRDMNDQILNRIQNM